MMRSLMVTGGAGFIGSNFVRYVLRTYPAVRIVNFDALTYAGNLENLADVAADPRYVFVRGDICDEAAVIDAIRGNGVDAVVHLAAESHVDRSILGASAFMRTNVLGTQTLLDACRECGVGRFLHVSTDEVYGSLGPDGTFLETTPLHPNSPYAASKASSDLVVQAYHHTYGFPAIISRCSNNYGPYQFPEKLIPLMIVNAMRGDPLPVYGDGRNVRDWLHVHDHCAALATILERAEPGAVYNIGGENEWRNIDIVRTILRLLGKPESLITFVKDRPGHDRRYAIDASKLRRDLGWHPTMQFERGMEETVQWYVGHQEWWKRVMTGDYLEYYRRNYHEA